jgi:hypothetical protein
MGCPQLFTTLTPHLPAQGVVSSGVQHPPSGMQTAEPAQADVPPEPHVTGRPQLFITVPHCIAPHAAAADSGTQEPHTPASRLQFMLPAHVVPQSTMRLQLSSDMPQRTPLHHVGSSTQSHRLLPASHA